MKLPPVECINGIDCRNAVEMEQVCPTFRSWFAGQTGMIAPDGRFMAYESDIQRFLVGKGDAEWEV